jgi:hypothetical protein
VCTGNENSKPIWNKFIIRKDIIETSQAVLNFCRTVYIVGYLMQSKMSKYWRIKNCYLTGVATVPPRTA